LGGGDTMIQGIVTEGMEAVVTMVVRDPKGATTSVEATIDTGFTYFLSLPEDVVQRLELPFVDRTRAFLADGSLVVIRLYRCHLLWDHLLTMQATADGPVTITPLAGGPR
jgi:clan AA aspartic protease